jgi:hypothetical protein
MASTFPLRRSTRALSTWGGFQVTNQRGPRGEPSSVTARVATPVSASASSTGLAMVALDERNWGSAP